MVGAGDGDRDKVVVGPSKPSPWPPTDGSANVSDRSGEGEGEAVAQGAVTGGQAEVRLCIRPCWWTFWWCWWEEDEAVEEVEEARWDDEAMEDVEPRREDVPPVPLAPVAVVGARPDPCVLGSTSFPPIGIRVSYAPNAVLDRSKEARFEAVVEEGALGESRCEGGRGGKSKAAEDQSSVPDEAGTGTGIMDCGSRDEGKGGCLVDHWIRRLLLVFPRQPRLSTSSFEETTHFLCCLMVRALVK